MRVLRQVLLLLLLAVAGVQSALAADAEAFFDHTFGDLQAELKAAAASGKTGVLVMFETENCPYCRRMREQVLNRADVQGYFRKHFTIFSLNFFGDLPLTDFAGRETTEKALARALKVRGTPTFVFFGAGGAELARLSGATKDAAEFMRLGRYVAEGHYKTMSLEQFSASSTERKP